MKKSKFLKKSLAMLLALMLVVAMIPLSAAAADPALSYLYIDNNSVANVDGEFAADVGYHADKVYLRVAENGLGYSDGTATLTATLEVYKEGNVTGLPVHVQENRDDIKNTEVDLNTWATKEGNVWTLSLRLIAGGSVVDTYTVTLTAVHASTTASLVENPDNSMPTNGTGTYVVDISNGSHDIDLTVPENSNGVDDLTYNFRVMTQDNATISQDLSNGVTVTDLGNSWYALAVDFDAEDPYIVVVSESNRNQAKFDINVTEVDSLRTFSYGEYTGTINNDDNTVTVTIPKEDASDDGFGDAVDFDLPVDFTTYGDTDKIYISDDENDRNPEEYQADKKLDIGQLFNDDDRTEDYYIWVDCAEVDKLQKYTLTFEISKDSNTAIEFAYFNFRQATIDGTEISAVLPMRDTVNNIDTLPGTNDVTDRSSVKVVLYTPESAEIESISGFTKATQVDGNLPDAIDEIDGYDMWYSGHSPVTVLGIDLTNGYLATVTAEDGTTQTYNLTASIETNSTAAEMSRIYITDGTTIAEGTIADNAITFTVPYMTTSVEEWTIFATPNAAAEVYGNGANGRITVRNGRTTMGDIGFNGDIINTADGVNRIDDALSVVNMNDDDYFNHYEVIVNFESADSGKTISEFTVSIQGTDPTENGQTNQKVSARVNASNSATAIESKGTITQEGDDLNNTGTITLGVRYGLRNDLENYKILTDIEVAEGGVAFLARLGSNGEDYYEAEVLADLTDDRAPFNGDVIYYTEDKQDDDKWYVIVLPEQVARGVLVNTGDDGVAAQYQPRINADEASFGTVYTVEESLQKASNERVMSNIYVEDANLTVENTHDVTTNNTEVGEVTGALPWSYTVSVDEANAVGNGKLDEEKGKFLTYDISAFATLTRDGAHAHDVGIFFSNGDTNGDGEVDPAGPGNNKLLFVRENDGTVSLYTYWNGKWRDTVDNTLTVVAEDGTSTMDYVFDLNWNPANTEAAITSFELAGATGRIEGEDIYVTVPYGTDLKGLIPTFTASEYATVCLDSREEAPVVSGETSVNFSQDVRLKVTSEDRKLTVPYTVHVAVAEAFSDVTTDDWYYENVMAAAAAGIVSGQGNGVFNPGANVTRRDFAIMLAQMLGISNNGTAVSPFIDVANTDYGVVAIAYCYEHDIISGYTDGTFQPDETITRQEAASMIVKAQGVSAVSDELYDDDASIASWAKDAVYKAKAAGLMKGDTNGDFRPTDLITRAEAASIMVNALYQ